MLLRTACQQTLEVFLTLTDCQPLPTRPLEPHLLSSSSRSIDVVLKRALYEQAGVEQYWVVDPHEPSVAIWSGGDGRYGEPLVVIRTPAVDGPVPVPVPVVLELRDLLR